MKTKPSRRPNTPSPTVRFHAAKVGLTIFFCTAFSTVISAQTVKWKTAANGEFNVGANWDTGVAPTSSDDTIFDVTGTYGVKLTQAESINRFQQFKGNMTLFGGFGLSTTGSAFTDKSELSITEAGTSLSVGTSYSVENGGTVNIIGGGALSNASGFLGGVIGSGSTNFALVDGAGSKWTNGDLFMGTSTGFNDRGNARLDISGGGVVQVGNNASTFSNPSGQLIVSDTTSNGNLYVRNGSKISNAGWTISSLTAGTSGNIFINGSGSEISNAGDAWIGYRGNSQLSVTDGGNFSSENGNLATFSGATATATIRGSGSLWTNTDSLSVGRFGNGILRVENGGMVSNKDGFLGRLSTGIGAATISGAGSRWNNENLFLGASSASNDGGSGAISITSNAVANVGNDLSAFTSTHLNVSDNGANGNFVVRNGSVVNNQGFTILGNGGTATGNATIHGAGSQWDNAGVMYVGWNGTGNLSVQSGAVVNNTVGSIGNSTSANGSVDVDGVGSQWNNSSTVIVGSSGTGSLMVTAGGQASGNATTYLGSASGSTGTLTVDGSGSSYDTGAEMSVGRNGIGTLNVTGGGIVSSGDSFLAKNAGSTGQATISGSGSTWNASRLFLGSDGANDGGSATLNLLDQGIVNVGDDVVNFGSLNVSDSGSDAILSVTNGAVVNGGNSAIVAGFSAGNSGSIVVDGAGSEINSNWILEVGANGSGSLEISNGGKVDVSGTRLAYNPGGSGSILVKDAGSILHGGSSISVGRNGSAEMVVEGGGMVTSDNGMIAVNSDGGVTIKNASAWQVANDLTVADNDQGFLLVLSGGQVSSHNGFIGQREGAVGTAVVEGQWQNTGNVKLGAEGGTGSMSVLGGGQVSAETFSLGTSAGGIGNTVVNGSGSVLTANEDLFVYRGELKIENDGLVVIRDAAQAFSNGSISVMDSELRFGVMQYDSYANRVSGSGSVISGAVRNGYGSPYVAMADLLDLSKPGFNTSGILHGNTGTIHGTGFSEHGLNNLSANAELRAINGEWMRFGGTGSQNSGSFHNFNGVIEFEEDLLNHAAGFIGGRGQFITGTGLTNQGTMAFSGGNADIIGGVSNIDAGTIITSGFGITTFFDDVIHNGAEIRTQVGSATVFLGAYSGAGAFTGAGDVFFEGEVSLGNSPDVVTVDGNVIFGQNTDSLFEIAGLEFGEYDKFIIGGNFSIDGNLSIDLLDGFGLGLNQEFLIAEVGGMTSGQFAGLDEGSLVGTYGGHDLFISYTRGDGNDVGLFTAVPEPNSLGLISLLILAIAVRRKRTS